MTQPVTSSMSSSALRTAIETVMEKHPDLSIHGWHFHVVLRPEWVGVVAGAAADPMSFMPAEVDRRRVDTERVRTAIFFIEKWTTPTKAIASRPTSYWLKHCAERYGRDAGMSNYVANGEFIIAALVTGHRYRLIETGRLCTFNMYVRRRPRGGVTV